MRIVLPALLALLPVSGAAEIIVDFRESAPKDSFTVTNTAQCDLAAFALRIDLSAAPAGLIFDTTASGKGVEVFQPFEIVSGSFTTRASVQDGDQMIDLDLPGLASGESIKFTIDVDDTQANGPLGQIRVSGAEIAGATVDVQGKGFTSRSVFDANARSVVPVKTCMS